MYLTDAFIVLACSLVPFVLGLLCYKRLSPSVRVIVAMMGLSTLSELISTIFAFKFNNMYPVYHVYNFIELCLFGRYFEHALSLQRKNLVFYSVCAVSLIGFGVNVLFIQSLQMLNSNFLLLEGFCVILLAVIAIARLFLDDEVLHIKAASDFWLSLIFLFYWSATYITWATYHIVVLKKSHLATLLPQIIWWSNVIMYGGIATVFYFSNRKLKPAYEH